MSDLTERKKMINAILKDNVAFLGDEELDSDVTDVIPTKSTLLDTALGGGIPTGRITEIIGEQAAGKTTVALSIIRGFQEKYPKGRVTYIDAERTFDKKRAQTIGVNTDEVLICYPDTIEECAKIFWTEMELQEKDPAPFIGVVDTLVSLSTSSEFENKEKRFAGGMGDLARTIRASMKPLLGHFAKHKATLLVLNHVIANLNPYAGGPESPGGSAIKFWSSVRINVRKSGWFKDPVTDQIIGITTKCKLVKNKVARPLLEAEFPISFKDGMEDDWGMFYYLHEIGKIPNKGAWYSLTNPADGKEHKFMVKQFKEFVKENTWALPLMQQMVQEALK